jgi:hypothetical protein
MEAAMRNAQPCVDKRDERIAALQASNIILSASHKQADNMRDLLVTALKDCVSVMERELNGLAVIQPELRQARAALSAAGVTP